MRARERGQHVRLDVAAGARVGDHVERIHERGRSAPDARLVGDAQHARLDLADVQTGSVRTCELAHRKLGAVERDAESLGDLGVRARDRHGEDEFSVRHHGGGELGANDAVRVERSHTANLVAHPPS